MKVIILQSFRSLGNVGSVIDVKPGYAENYLIPIGVAKYATKESLLELEANRQNVEHFDSVRRSEAESVKVALDGSFLLFVRQASDDGRLYGSVSNTDVLKAFEDKCREMDLPFAVQKGDIFLGTGVKSIGVHECRIALHGSINLNIKLNVCRSESDSISSIARYESGGDIIVAETTVAGSNLPYRLRKQLDRINRENAPVETTVDVATVLSHVPENIELDSRSAAEIEMDIEVSEESAAIEDSAVDTSASIDLE